MKMRSIWAIALIAILNISGAEAAQSSAESILDSLAVKGRAAKLDIPGINLARDGRM